jgi:hypothetical protein
MTQPQKYQIVINVENNIEEQAPKQDKEKEEPMLVPYNSLEQDVQEYLDDVLAKYGVIVEPPQPDLFQRCNELEQELAEEKRRLRSTLDDLVDQDNRLERKRQKSEKQHGKRMTLYDKIGQIKKKKNLWKRRFLSAEKSFEEATGDRITFEDPELARLWKHD